MQQIVLDEDTIKEALDCEMKPGTAHRLCQGVMLSLLNSWDRKITRENFYDLLTTALKVQSAAVQMIVINNILKKVTTPEGFGEKDVIAALDALHDLGNQELTKLAGLHDLVTQCPLECDTRH